MDLWNPDRLSRLQKWFESAYLTIFRCRRWVIAAIAAFCLIALSGLPKLRLDNTMDVWFSDQTPPYVKYRQFIEMFGRDEYLFIALDMGDVFTRDHLEILNRLDAVFHSMPGIVEVMGLPNATDVRSTSGSQEIGIYVHELRESFAVESREFLRRRILSDERFTQTLVSKDGSVAVFLLRFENPKIGTTAIGRVEDILRSAGVSYHLGGYIFAQREMDRLTFREYFIFGGVCLAVLVTVFWMLFHDIWITSLFIVDCVLTVGVVLGCMGWVGTPIHLMTGTIPPLLMAMAIADDLHMVERFLRDKSPGTSRERVARICAEVAIPSLLSGFTTFAGFISLTGGEVPAIAHFGFWSGFGILFTYIFSFFTVPIMLTYLPMKKSEVDSPPHDLRVEEKLYGFCSRHRKLLIGVSMALTLLSVDGIRKIVVDTQMTNFFREDSDFMRSMDFIESRFGNTGPVEIVLTAPNPDGLKTVDFLQKTERLIGRLKQIPKVDVVLSLDPVLKTMTQSLYEGRPGDYRLPNRPDLLEQELLVLSLSESGEETLNRYVTSDWTQFRIQARLPRMSNNEALELFQTMENTTRDVFGEHQTFYLTGVVEAYSKLDRFILSCQMQSLWITVVIIALVFWMQVGNPLLAFLALAPNVLPIVFMFATMGWAGITLNVATATVAAITLGLADDDTVYFFYAYQRRRKSGLSAKEALPGALDECTRALWLATILNVAGFSIFVFSSFRPTIYFGLLTSEVWILAILAEFLLLPPLLLTLDRKSYGK